ncbi:protein MONOCULM 1-like [Oryza brachyantha]|uniref:protein MONOCULM 1-like n=1 Tax=Oryza brachyantha TaxID=4533 RepID=UPI001ADA9DE8|nr:protein MONOCULM 1-like [Oryza brachyantha]
MLLCGRADDPSCPDAVQADDDDAMLGLPAARGDRPPDDDGDGGGGGGAAPAAAGSGQRPLSPGWRAGGGGEARGLVLACADLVHRGDIDGARRAAEDVLAGVDPRGDAADRLAHHFARALLALRVGDRGGGGGGGGEGAVGVGVGAAPSEMVPSSVAYLAYIKIAPFLRFAHLTANQAILEAAADDGAHRRVLHIVDLDAAHGVQWPPLLQAIANRADPAVGPPEVRLTGAGPDRDVLLRTGDRLRAFASSLNLPFRFHPLILPCTAELAADPTAALELHPDETLAVNCVLFLHKLGSDSELAAFLRWVKSMNPAVVTIAEREGTSASASTGDGSDDVPDELPRRVAAAMDYYSSVFDALEATVAPASADRLAVEQEILSREIDAAVSGPGSGGGRARGFNAWASAARTAGLAPRPLSAFAASQARLLLRLHYPSEGYAAEDDGRGACFLRWQDRQLMSVSSWQPQ